MSDIKKNDFFATLVKNGDATISDLRGNNITPENSSFLSADEYKKMDAVREYFTGDDGKFDEKKFQSSYDMAKEFYTNYAEADYLTNVMQNLSYSTDAWYAPKDANYRKDNTVVLANQRPADYSMGISYITAIDEKASQPLSIREQAQTQKVFNTEKGEWEDYSPNDKAGLFTRHLLPTLVLAQYDEDGYHMENGQEVAHKAGDLKLNDDYKPYYETLGDREVYGKEVLRNSDILTVDGGRFNKIDIFDSDDVKKNAFKVAAATVAKMAPLLLPGIGEIYGFAKAADGLMEVLPVLGKAIDSVVTGTTDNNVGRALTKWENFTQRYKDTSSDYAKEHIFALENIGNMASSVTEQLYSQRALSTIPAIFAKVRGTTDYAKIAEASKALSFSYMAATSSQEMYSEAKEAGANDKTAGLMMLGSSLALYKLMGIDYFRDNILKDTFMDESATRQALAGSAKTVSNEMSHLFKAAEGSTKNAAGFVNKVKDFYANTLVKGIQQKGAAGLLARSASEGTEEVMEEVLADSIKAFNLGLEAVGFNVSEEGKNLDFGFSAKDMGARYLTSFIGGAIGGAVFAGKDSYDAWLDGKKANMTSVDLTDDQRLLYMLATGKRKEIDFYLDKWHKKGMLGSKDLKLDQNGGTLVEGTRGYIPVGKELNQNDAVYYAVKKRLDTLEQTIKSEVPNIGNFFTQENIENLVKAGYSEDEIFHNSKLLTASALATLQEYSGFKEDFIKNLTDIVATKNALEARVKELAEQNKTTTDDQKQEQSKAIKDDEVVKQLTEKLEKLRAEKDSFIDGTKTPYYSSQALFALDPEKHKPFVKLDIDSFVNLKYGKNFNSLSEEEQNKLKAEHEEYMATEGKSQIYRAHDFFLDLSQRFAPQIQETVKLMKQGKLDVKIDKTLGLTDFLEASQKGAELKEKLDALDPEDKSDETNAKREAINKQITDLALKRSRILTNPELFDFSGNEDIVKAVESNVTYGKLTLLDDFSRRAEKNARVNAAVDVINEEIAKINAEYEQAERKMRAFDETAQRTTGEEQVEARRNTVQATEKLQELSATKVALEAELKAAKAEQQRVALSDDSAVISGVEVGERDSSQIAEVLQSLRDEYKEAATDGNVKLDDTALNNVLIGLGKAYKMSGGAQARYAERLKKFNAGTLEGLKAAKANIDAEYEGDEEGAMEALDNWRGGNVDADGTVEGTVNAIVAALGVDHDLAFAKYAELKEDLLKRKGLSVEEANRLIDALLPTVNGENVMRFLGVIEKYKKDINYSPFLDLLKKLGTSSDDLNLLKLIDQEGRKIAGSSSINDYLMRDPLIKESLSGDRFSRIIGTLNSLLTAAADGTNDIIRNFKTIGKKDGETDDQRIKDLAVMDNDTYEVLRAQGNYYLDRINSFVRLANINNSKRLRIHKDTAINIRPKYIKAVVSLGEIAGVNIAKLWGEVSENVNLDNINEDNFAEFEQAAIKFETALGDAFTALSLSKEEFVDKVLEKFDKSKLIPTQGTRLNDDKDSVIQSMELVNYLMTLKTMPSDAFASVFKSVVDDVNQEELYAPIIGHEIAIKQLVAQTIDPELYNLVIDKAAGAVVTDDPYYKNKPVLHNFGLVLGSAGSGKTKGVLRIINEILKRSGKADVICTAMEDNQAKKLASSIGTDAAMTVGEYCQKVFGKEIASGDCIVDADSMHVKLREALGNGKVIFNENLRVLMIDEVETVNEPTLLAITKDAEAHGIFVIGAGDLKQPNTKITYNLSKKVNNKTAIDLLSGIDDCYFVATPTLTSSMRSDYLAKLENAENLGEPLDVISTKVLGNQLSLDSERSEEIRKHLKSPKLYYWENPETGELFGDRDVDTKDEFEHKIAQLAKLYEGQTPKEAPIAIITDNASRYTDLIKQYNGTVKTVDYVDYKKRAGGEWDYAFVDADFKGIHTGKGALYTLTQDIYTLTQRSRKGTVILADPSTKYFKFQPSKAKAVLVKADKAQYTEFKNWRWKQLANIEANPEALKGLFACVGDDNARLTAEQERLAKEAEEAKRAAEEAKKAEEAEEAKRAAEEAKKAEEAKRQVEEEAKKKAEEEKKDKKEDIGEDTPPTSDPAPVASPAPAGNEINPEEVIRTAELASKPAETPAPVNEPEDTGEKPKRPRRRRSVSEKDKFFDVLTDNVFPLAVREIAAVKKGFNEDTLDALMGHAEFMPALVKAIETRYNNGEELLKKLFEENPNMDEIALAAMSDLKGGYKFNGEPRGYKNASEVLTFEDDIDATVEDFNGFMDGNDFVEFKSLSNDFKEASNDLFGDEIFPDGHPTPIFYKQLASYIRTGRYEKYFDSMVNNLNLELNAAVALKRFLNNATVKQYILPNGDKGGVLVARFSTTKGSFDIPLLTISGKNIPCGEFVGSIDRIAKPELTSTKGKKFVDIDKLCASTGMNRSSSLFIVKAKIKQINDALAKGSIDEPTADFLKRNSGKVMIAVSDEPAIVQENFDDLWYTDSYLRKSVRSYYDKTLVGVQCRVNLVDVLEMLNNLYGQADEDSLSYLPNNYNASKENPWLTGLSENHELLKDKEGKPRQILPLSRAEMLLKRLCTIGNSTIRQNIMGFADAADKTRRFIHVDGKFYEFRAGNGASGKVYWEVNIGTNNEVTPTGNHVGSFDELVGSAKRIGLTLIRPSKKGDYRNDYSSNALLGLALHGLTEYDIRQVDDTLKQVNYGIYLDDNATIDDEAVGTMWREAAIGDRSYVCDLSGLTPTTYAIRINDKTIKTIPSKPEVTTEVKPVEVAPTKVTPEVTTKVAAGVTARVPEIDEFTEFLHSNHLEGLGKTVEEVNAALYDRKRDWGFWRVDALEDGNHALRFVDDYETFKNWCGMSEEAYNDAVSVFGGTIEIEGNTLIYCNNGIWEKITADPNILAAAKEFIGMNVRCEGYVVSKFLPSAASKVDYEGLSRIMKSTSEQGDLDFSKKIANFESLFDC